MANVKVTALPELSADQVDNCTWLLAAHKTDDEQTSNKLNYSSISANMLIDLSVDEIKQKITDLEDIVDHGYTTRLAEVSENLDNLSSQVERDYIDFTRLNVALSSKQDTLKSGENIKTLTIDGESHSLLEEGTIVINSGSDGHYQELLEKIAKKQDILSSGVNIKKLKVGSTTYDLTGSGIINVDSSGTVDSEARAAIEKLQPTVQSLSDTLSIVQPVVEEHTTQITNLVQRMTQIAATKIFAAAQYTSQDISFSTEKQVYSCTFSLRNDIGNQAHKAYYVNMLSINPANSNVSIFNRWAQSNTANNVVTIYFEAQSSSAVTTTVDVNILQYYNAED